MPYRVPVNIATSMECMNRRCRICYRDNYQKTDNEYGWAPKYGAVVIGENREYMLCNDCVKYISNLVETNN